MPENTETDILAEAAAAAAAEEAQEATAAPAEDQPPQKPAVEAAIEKPAAKPKGKKASKAAETKDEASAAAATAASKQAASIAGPGKAGYTWFVAATDDVAPYTIHIGTGKGERIDGTWNRDRTRACWRVPNYLVARFSKHIHVLSGRIVKAKA